MKVALQMSIESEILSLTYIKEDRCNRYTIGGSIND